MIRERLIGYIEKSIRQNWNIEALSNYKEKWYNYKEIAEKMCGKPEKAAVDDRVVAAIKWVDGTVIDAVRKVKK